MVMCAKERERAREDELRANLRTAVDKARAACRCCSCLGGYSVEQMTKADAEYVGLEEPLRPASCVAATVLEHLLAQS